MSASRPLIVIVGGGFAGANLTRLLQRRARFADVTLISEESYTTFNPMLAEVAGATTKLVARGDARRVPARGERVTLRPRAEEAHLFVPDTGERIET